MKRRFLKNRKNLDLPKIRRQRGFLSLKLARIFLLIALAVGGVYYIGLINNKATAGYKIKNLEKKVYELNEFNQKLELTLIDLQDLKQVKQKAENMKMVAADKVEYLSVKQGGLVLR